ncbi:hypothetical protein MTR67_049111 [Solanum verrucosum]|uniref:ABC-type xenobiotic transporter n=1 Tax=Solanum verrucosum TaxID=315347 RepID=A0AAF0ZY10_SOLVR|nr:hypothetical protein MTR67_049111 [Solanum verrucosum]
MFLCITSMWKFDNVIDSTKAILNALSFVGALLLLCIGFIKESEYDETFYKPLQEFEDGIITPFANAGFLGKLSFWWLNPLMKKGKRKILEDEDVPHLRSADGAGTCFDLFNEKMDMLKRKDPLGKPSILMAILLCHKKSILISGVFALIKILMLTTGPLFLHTFIKVAEGRESFKYEGFALTAGFFLAKCLESLAERQWLFRSRLIGLQVKSSLTAAIFHKQLHVLNAAKKTHSPGQIMNYVTVDAHKIGEFPFWFHQIWTTILQLVLVLCVMYYSIGVAASAALVIVILTVVVNSPLAKLQLKYQTNLMIAQDKRLKAITEALAHIKVLKLYSWEKHFMDAISKLRSEETKWLSSVQTQKGYYLLLFWSSPILVSSATFVACYLFGVPLHVSNVFTFLASIKLVQAPIRRLPDVVGAFIEAKVSLSRIVKFLEEPDMHTRDMKKQRQDDVNICLNCTDVSWEMNSLKPTLKDINLTIKHGEKVAVCGEVGSGKSTLLSLILGEVPYINGTVDVYGKIAYVSQTAWIQTGTIQENILFGSNMEPQRYRQALERSSLVKDLEMLPFGDLTEIGERGNNLSGGQKQRDYVMGALSGKTVLLVTHQVEFLPAFDSILLLSNGKIMKSGAFDKLLSKSKEFQDLVNAQKTPSDPKCQEVYASNKSPKAAEIESDNNVSSEERDDVVSLEGDQLIKAEEREVGDAGLKPYKQYLKHYKGFLYFSLAAIAHTMFVVGQYIQSYKLAIDLQDSSVSRLKLINVYAVIGFGLIIFLVLRSFLTVKMGLDASKSVYSTLSSSLFFAPMSFFDSTPLGRMLSRVSSDLSIVDIELAFLINFTVGSIIILYSTYVILCIFAPEVLLVIVLMIHVTILVQRYYNASAKELMRLNGTTKSLVANHLAESISGIMTIRAFGQEGRFFLKNLEFIDKNARPIFHTFSATEWLILRLEIICTIIMSSWMLGMTWLHRGSSISGLTGMAFSYGLSLNAILVLCVQWQCTIANSIISIERLEQYMRIPSEESEILQINSPLPCWPTRGKVEIRDLKVRYRPNAPLVLQGISCTFEGGQKIGVVGRTGSGKTTLISALFRLVEPTDGKIIIDECDISTIRLHDLRSRIGIIPQDPTLFTGSVRYNLDPLSKYSDDQIWEVLDKCQLREAVQEKEGGLDSSVLQDGSNWSMGQRQLFCLGRALLKRSRILVLDEATASIDNATDAILQKTIRLEFADCTVITVAHRIPTVMDYTKVLAISDGNLVEFDEPKKLINKEGSLFGMLVKEYWARYIAFGVWKLKEQHQEFEVLLLLVHGITWLFESEYDETFYNPLQEFEDGITSFANAGFLGKLSFWWLNPLMKKGKSKILEEGDVPRLRLVDGAGTCFDMFNEKVQMLKRKDPLGKPSILMAILLCHQKSILISGVFALIKILMLTTGPLFLHTFIEVADGRESFKYEGYALSAGFFLAKCLESLAERQWLFRSRLIGLQVKSSLTAAIFHKQLHVLNAAKKTHSPGQIMNYVTVDAHKIDEFPFWFHQIWTTILQLVLVLCVMYYTIGIAASAALVIIILTVLVNSPLAKLQLKYQTNLMIAQDKRLKAITEALARMKVLKLYSWEKHFMDAISKLRSEETKWLSSVQTQRGYYLLLFWSSPILVSSATFVACYLFGVPLHVSSVFTFLASIRLVQLPIRNLPDVVGAFIEAKVSLSRIVKFLEEPDMHTRDMKKQRQDDVNICVNCTDVSWEMNSLKPTLKGITLDIKHGEKVAVDVYGKIAYVSQTAWIQTGTIQENILFGSNMEPQRYRQALERSSRVKDLEILPFGDLTEIGERGNNLSGGQKQRVQLARALYQDADIYLLDDPFSAVDAHTSTNLFNDYVVGALSGKTVLLVTHQVEFLPAFDSILDADPGYLNLHHQTMQANWHQYMECTKLLSKSKEFQDLVNAQKTPSDPKCQEVYASNKSPKAAEIESDNNVSSEERDEVDSLEGDQLIKAEEREVGDAGLKPYIQYLKHYKGFLYFSLAAIAHTMFVVGQYIQSYKLAIDLQDSSISRLKLINVYAVIGFGLIIFLVIRSLLTVKMGLDASKSVNSTLSNSLFFAPMSFFDSTPLGRILSRISSDMSIVDIELPFLINFTVGSIIILYSTYVILCFFAPEVLLVIVLMIYVTILVQRYYNASAKELMRLNGTTKSLVANHLAESISGITTIRASAQEGRFFFKNLKFIDKNARTIFHTFSATEWLILRLEIICTIIMSSWMLGMTWLHRGSSISGLTGMAFSYGLSLNAALVLCVRWQCTIANSIVSIERLEQYMRIPSEESEQVQTNHPLPGWPTRGKVEIHDLKVRYRPNAPLVLQGISCTFEGGQKIGVVGRTGSGKTTLISALFRLVEPTDGKIIIDECDISTIRLHDLRSRIGIIPQDPTLFTGSVRYNLDPLSEYSDDQIWEVLDKCQLREAVQEKEGGLDSSVLQDGSNWSMGQRQLFCLGRALLKRSRILVLDEATASIDNATDAILQKTIRLEFADCTVITVAHRIPTVMDYTKVLAISNGRLVEFDEPKKLINKEGSLFGMLVKEYWARTQK